MRYLVAFISIWMVFSACNSEKKSRKAIGNPLSILESSATFWAYQYKHVHFYKDFTPLDAKSNTLSREAFFTSLATGNYLPLKLFGTDSSVFYQLYPLNGAVAENTRYALKNWAREKYENYTFENRQVPTYKFVDLAGNEYTSESNKGKIVVLKCWFVRCTPCVKEMPALNEIKKQYANRNDIVFISLCTDSNLETESLLKKTQFDYTTVADQKNYVTQDLQVGAYPTHFVIDKSGKIQNRTTDYHEMAYVLQKVSSVK